MVAGLRVIPANQAEGPVLWELLETFQGAVGRGVLKKLIVDRGFIDGPHIGKLKTEYGVDTVIPVRKNMDILQDVRGLVKLGMKWEEYERPRRQPLTPPRPARHPAAAGLAAATARLRLNCSKNTPNLFFVAASSIELRPRSLAKAVFLVHRQKTGSPSGRFGGKICGCLPKIVGRGVPDRLGCRFGRPQRLAAVGQESPARLFFNVTL